VEASNSCVRTLIFDSFSFIVFLSVFSFYSPLFTFFVCFSVLLSFLLFLFGFFITLRFPTSFSLLFCLCFPAHVGFISSLPQLAWHKKAWLLLSVVITYILLAGNFFLKKLTCGG
jgi:hypothetical protein